MPAYNAERYVAEAVESILAQTFADFEFLIVDDGSTDGTLAILERYANRDARIHLVSRPNTGYLVALNEMLGRSRGRFIARMDADDVALPERFDRQVDYLGRHPDCVMVGSRVTIIDPEGSPLTVMEAPTEHEEIVGSLMASGGQLVYHPSVMFRREALLAVGPYREEFLFAEDLDIFLRLAEIGRIANLAEPLLKYREHFANVGHVKAERQDAAVRAVLEAAFTRRGETPPSAVLRRSPRDPTRSTA